MAVPQPVDDLERRCSSELAQVLLLPWTNRLLQQQQQQHAHLHPWGVLYPRRCHCCRCGNQFP